MIKVPLPHLNPKKWYQWVIYLLIAVIPNLGNISNLITSYQMDIPYSGVAMAIHQNDLWRKNCDCVRETTSVIVVTTPSNVQVKFLVCESGDALMQATYPSGKTHAKWVSPSSMTPLGEGYSLFNFYSIVYAGAPVEQPIEVICHWEDSMYRYFIYKDLTTGACLKKKMSKWNTVVEYEDHPCISKKECPKSKKEK